MKESTETCSRSIGPGERIKSVTFPVSPCEITHASLCDAFTYLTALDVRPLLFDTKLNKV